MDKLRVGYAAKAAGTAPVWTACETGVFRALDLEVESVHIPGSMAVARAIDDGVVDFSNFAAPAAVQAALVRGSDQVTIIAGLHRLMQTLMGRPGLTQLEQVRGGRFGIQTRGEVNHRILQLIVPRLGWAIGRDVELVEYPRGPEEDWRRADVPVDALVLHAPAPFAAARDGWYPLLDMRSLDVPFPMACVSARRAWLQEHDEMVHRFVQGYVEGMFQFKSDRALAVTVLQKYSSSTDPEVLAQTHDVYGSEFVGSPGPHLEAFRNVLRTMQDELPNARVEDAERFVDGHFIADVEANGVLSSLRAKYNVH